MSELSSKQDLVIDPQLQIIIEALHNFVTNEHCAVALEIDLPEISFSTHLNGTKQFPAASILKLPIAMAIEEQSQRGELDLHETHQLSEVLNQSRAHSVLRGMVSSKTITTEELLRVMLIASDELATFQLRTILKTQDVNTLITESGCLETYLSEVIGPVSVLGKTSANDALRLMSLTTSEAQFPTCASALKTSILNSRIPLGAQEFDISLLHKTGSLPGVAHDVAELTTEEGFLRIAFLTENQTDTVLTGYKMGLCTREILEACGVSVKSTRSIMTDSHV